MNVFIIGTTHQLMQVSEAIKYYNLVVSDSLLMFMISGEEKSVDTSLVPDGLPVLFLNNWVFRDLMSKRHHRKFVDCINSLKNKYKEFNLFSSYYSSDCVLLAFAILKPKVFVLMDEGTASVNVVKKRKEKSTDLIKLTVKSLFYHQHIFYPSCIHFFSQYELGVSHEDILDLYTFEQNRITLSKDPNYAIVLGTTLPEVGAISWDSYSKMLITISRILKEKGIEKVDYYSHRKESIKKKNLIKDLNWSYIENSKPFEYKYPLLSPSPSIIFSFLSPILDNLTKQFSDLPELIVVYFTEKICIDGNYDLYRELYNIYSKNKLLRFITINENDDDN